MFFHLTRIQLMTLLILPVSFSGNTHWPLSFPKLITQYLYTVFPRGGPSLLHSFNLPSPSLSPEIVPHNNSLKTRIFPLVFEPISLAYRWHSLQGSLNLFCSYFLREIASLLLNVGFGFPRKLLLQTYWKLHFPLPGTELSGGPPGPGQLLLFSSWVVYPNSFINKVLVTCHPTKGWTCVIFWLSCCEWSSSECFSHEIILVDSRMPASCFPFQL